MKGAANQSDTLRRLWPFCPAQRKFATACRRCSRKRFGLGAPRHASYFAPGALRGCGAFPARRATGREPPPGPKRQVSLKAPAGAPAPAPAADDDNESFKPEKHGDDFVTRRLAVINPFDAGEAAEGEGGETGEGF